MRTLDKYKRQNDESFQHFLDNCDKLGGSPV
jgi:hypothetical protein